MKNHWPWANNPEQLNPFELQKLEQDGLDIIDEIIHIYSKKGFESIPEEKFALFKWAGVYQQRPKKDGYFMIRIRVPSGILNSRQVRVVAELVEGVRARADRCDDTPSDSISLDSGGKSSGYLPAFGRSRSLHL